jgi:hypothetical protein
MFYLLAGERAMSRLGYFHIRRFRLFDVMFVITLKIEP